MEFKSKVVANKRLLVANRGEIAIRIFRAASELNVRTIAIYSHEDRFAMHRFKADEAYRTGKPGDPLGAYLNWQEIIELAKRHHVDAIHPGYGFLSENPDFARACAAADIMFCGPSPDLLEMFGDKLKAKQSAIRAGISVIPGTLEPVKSIDEAIAFANSVGYPITLKALSGGGGKGIRSVANESDLRQSYDRAKSEAKSSFGRDEIYLEKTVVTPKHIEVQVMGDAAGHVVHLYERDCSVQRRHQKIVETAPALGISDSTRKALLTDAVKLAKSVKYVGVGTIEFLVDRNGSHYFLEVNPRIQVEHTVTEMVTGVDIVQASIMLAAGRDLSHPAIGILGQESIVLRGAAVQCRITTEDPLRDFAPDTGTIIAYRPPQGFGIRLDEGLATSGGVVTPYYDSLLVKVTGHGNDFYGAARKMIRALKEFRIRGIRTNIPLLVNIVSHPRFFTGEITTNFLADTPDLYQFPTQKDRANKIMKYLADVTINNPHGLSSKKRSGESDAIWLAPDTSLINPETKGKPTAKDVFRKEGTAGLVKWIKEQPRLLLTDTTMRDAHQSLFATRMRNRDIFKAADFYRENGSDFFSLESWGGATFDTSYRFQKEDPWERLATLREKIPNALLQMLLRGDNAVGYTNYPEWVVRDFIRLTVEAGLDVFRIFDCLNNPEQMSVAMDEVKKRGGIVEACICYTGNIIDPKRTKYSLKYYLELAKRLETMGTDILCIKDMAGLLRPAAAELLIRELRATVNVPIHLHTHATSGNSEAMLLAASRAGCHIVDGAVASMSGLTSQPSLNAVVAALEGDARCPSVPLATLDRLSRYWEGIRTMYHAFETSLRSTTTRVYEHEIPGGQYSNLYDQAAKVGVSAEEFDSITERYKEVNTLFGDIIKVTPSSKVVGDMALLLHKHKLSGPDWIQRKPALDYPDSVVSFMKGHMGVPLGGFPENARQLVLGPNPPAPEKPKVDKEDSYESVRQELSDIVGSTPSPRDTLSYRLYPRVYLDWWRHNNQYGDVDVLPTPAFFFGLETGEEVEVEIEQGKTLYISLQGISNADKDGWRTVFFKLNGFPREIRVQDESFIVQGSKRPKADITNARHIGAPMPGKVLKISVKEGQAVTAGAVLLVTESMKMEYAVTAKASGTVKGIFAAPGDLVSEGDLLIALE